MAHDPKTIKLPAGLVGPIELNRLIRELEAIEASMQASELKREMFRLPHTSRMLEEMSVGNGLDLADTTKRTDLLKFLIGLKTSAPVVHMSFNEDPSVGFIQHIVTWMRVQIHPYTLIRVGLQPNIGIGCKLRTRNKYFDFSLRQHFLKRQDLLLKRLQKALSETETDSPPVVLTIPQSGAKT